MFRQLVLDLLRVGWLQGHLRPQNSVRKSRELSWQQLGVVGKETREPAKAAVTKQHPRRK